VFKFLQILSKQVEHNLLRDITLLIYL